MTKSGDAPDVPVDDVDQAKAKSRKKLRLKRPIQSAPAQYGFAEREPGEQIIEQGGALAAKKRSGTGRPRGARSRARELALQAFYQCEIAKVHIDTATDQLMAGKSPQAIDLDYFKQVARGVWEDREALDSQINQAADRWQKDRIAVIDRNILRLGVHELQTRTDVPVQVVINEAIELAKRFGGDGSGRFINGVLDSLAETLRSGRSENRE